MIAVSKMAAAVQPSATLAAAAKARQLKAEGVNVYDFSLGEPDFITPEHIRAAAVAAMSKGHTRYTPANGTVEESDEPGLSDHVRDFEQQVRAALLLLGTPSASQ